MGELAAVCSAYSQCLRLVPGLAPAISARDATHTLFIQLPQLGIRRVQPLLPLSLDATAHRLE
jgi:hypothetical protein